MGAAPSIVDAPPEVRATIEALVNQALDAQKAELTAHAKAGAFETLDNPAGLPRLKNQHIFDAYDPYKGKGIRAAQFVKCLLIARVKGQDPKSVAAEFEAKGVGDPLVTKALAEQTLVDGGVLVPPEFSTEFIQLLRAMTVVRELGVRVVPMTGAQLVLGRQNSAGVATYEGENMAVLASQQTFGQLKLLARKLMALTAVSNDLIRDAGPTADMIVRDDLAAVMALRMDLAALRGDGFSETPKGLLNLTNSANKFSATQGGSAATFAEMAGDIEKAIMLIKQANVPFQISDLGWAMHPRSEAYLKSVSSTYGVFPFRDEVRQGTLSGAKIRTTTQIPVNLGGSSNESEIYLAAWQHYYMGENTSLSIEVFPGGTYADASGTLQSGISSDQTPIRAIMRHDFQLKYDKAAVVIDTVKWGV